MELNKIYNEDCLEGMKKLPDQCVDCVVTSPPYWGLRDYGTAEWKGGDTDCDHKERDKVQGNPVFNENRPSREATSYQFKDVCKKCGAVRVDKQLGLEKSPDEYVGKMVEIFKEVKRVLKDEGTVWLNLGDSYNGSGGAGGDYNKGGLKEGQPKYPGRKIQSLKPKDLVGIPWRVAFALQADGWYLRSDIIWSKPNPMPESVTDRPTKAHEYIFLLTKKPKYFYDADAIKEESVTKENRPDGVVREREFGYDSKRNNNPDAYKYITSNKPSGAFNGKHGDKSFRAVVEKRNKRSVWTVTTKPFPDAHFAVYPPELIEPCVRAGCPEKGVVLDPFMGAGTTALVALQQGKRFIGFELNKEYIDIAMKRLKPLLEQKKIEEY